MVSSDLLEWYDVDDDTASCIDFRENDRWSAFECILPLFMSWQCMVVQTLSNAFLWLHVGSLIQRVTLGSYVNEMHCLPAYRKHIHSICRSWSLRLRASAIARSAHKLINVQILYSSVCRHISIDFAAMQVENSAYRQKVIWAGYQGYMLLWLSSIVVPVHV